ncbi:sensor histidine kinase [Actinomadura litoris]|uniref:sensor histidine kinase n=1 Tax=Actinomadura litoris TaxID=2678616 RepID=UPI001FA6D06B|nr:sensor histidine kinase [Actinomadura litoris]
MTRPEQVPAPPPSRPRTRSITRRIWLLLAIPLVSLMIQWGVPTVVTLSQALQRFQYSTVYDNVAQPARAVTEAIQEERGAAVGVLATGTAENDRYYQSLAARTDAAVAAFRKKALASGTRDAMDDAAKQRVRQLSETFDGLEGVRTQVRGAVISRLDAINGYSRITDTTIRVMTTLVSVDDVTVYQHSNAIVYDYWAREFMLRENALLTGLRPGRMNAGDRAAFASWAGSRAQYADLGRASAGGEIGKIMTDLTETPAFTAYADLERTVVRTGYAPDPRRWRGVVASVSSVWLRAATRAGDVVNRKDVEPAGDRILVGFYTVGGLGLLGFIASVVLSVLFARRLTEELRALQRTAQVLAHERLPRVVARLRRGESVDAEAEAPPPQTGRTREVAAVSEAFHAVQRTAVATAVGEAELRANINRVFINLSWRSQSLLHRQLRLLDAMERRARSPEELDDLFRLDHLTTRMRRHAEGLVILSGSPTIRAWDHPVAAEDVIRAAIAEVEDYRRVEVTGASSAAVTGAVVADVIHLLAELIENAASFSPPATEVTVKVETVANGLAVEIVDRGVGLHPEEMDELNRRLSTDLEFDLVDTERLGLFVVARLAARHGVKVALQPSPYGGTTAIVLVPHSLVVLDEELQLTRGPAGARVPEAALPALAGPASYSPPSYTPQAEPPAEPAPSEPPPTVPHPAEPVDEGAQAVVDPPAPSNGRSRPGGADPEPNGTESSEVTGRLPRRVRQRNLAPQLRKRPAPGRAAEPAEEEFEEPSPELSRDLMASLQSGWLRGRDSDDDIRDPGARDEWGES